MKFQGGFFMGHLATERPSQSIKIYFSIIIFFKIQRRLQRRLQRRNNEVKNTKSARPNEDMRKMSNVVENLIRRYVESRV